ncbi:NAD-dependent epimerase/dehydratase family protein [Kroppenstedtia eburnea]|uniref:Nucleoside-diphosphate-sugar epimerase n=1 Tax=Kroppenstedtia eburnea TaxID=714067 RepID=A0A1N7LD55_9BACL|nr:NAD-dependent epimerase/dehydratase family protein [Kroppenstedtia eburnea]EGK07653.1 NAD dependent epimerase/dehydratase [Desmospora sp. 8437]QKI81406.1 NAD-dependent epimerase/dehydratase family protein [Kroppenstedtia eburnea]SIS71727.1 Nucleoside-diphosphate-sugar epimerase [Kroppenstedtia eburnea]
MRTVDELEEKLAEPSPSLVTDLSRLEGDLMILGVGGKMGPSLAKLAKNALDQAGVHKRVIGVSRFSNKDLQHQLEARGIETISADLLDEAQLRNLPEVKNIIYMIGQKFGTSGREYFTWAMNTYLPARVAERFRNSRIVAFSTGNVYPLTPVVTGGASEEQPVEPVGEYAQSCLGRERILEYFSRKYEIPLLQFRLNYAIDLRYGVLCEIARAVREQKPIDLRMGQANVIWQGDANEMALRGLKFCATPPRILNVTGPETVSIRWLAQRFGEFFGIEPVFIHEEQTTALLNNASQAHQIFGYPKVSLRRMMEWTAAWVESDGDTFDKPTHFQERAGRF